jgi:hypothetical protein
MPRWPSVVATKKTAGPTTPSSRSTASAKSCCAEAPPERTRTGLAALRMLTMRPLHLTA